VNEVESKQEQVPAEIVSRGNDSSDSVHRYEYDTGMQCKLRQALTNQKQALTVSFNSAQHLTLLTMGFWSLGGFMPLVLNGNHWFVENKCAVLMSKLRLLI